MSAPVTAPLVGGAVPSLEVVEFLGVATLRCFRCRQAFWKGERLFWLGDYALHADAPCEWSFATGSETSS